MANVLRELGDLGALPAQLAMCSGPVDRWRLPLAAALELESHVGKRALAVGLAGGFSAALSGQWLYPALQSAVLAAGIVDKALGDPRPQDVFGQFDARWRQKLAGFLRSPNTQLPFLLPLVFSNQQIADRFCRSYLFGESF
jgi:hypothetical protein